MIQIKLKERIQAFSKLGQFLDYFVKNGINQIIDEKYYSDFQKLIENVEKENGWFIPQFVINSLQGLVVYLQEAELQKWCATYNLPELNKKTKRVGVVMAGNIPMVGFHDMLSILISGHIFVGKLSSKDKKLISFLIKVLLKFEPKFQDYIFIQEKLSNIEAIIATGSNNSSRYFDYYFGKYPNIIRHNRTSIAILSGNESDKQMKALANDIFMYFGMGCRNVSKVLVPDNYDIRQLFEYFEEYKFLHNHVKYMNNYDYYHSIYLLNKHSFLQNEFVLLRQETDLFSPLSVLYYNFYKDISQAEEYVNSNKESLQCIVTNCFNNEITVDFGQTQKPSLSIYADVIDTMKFLKSI